MKVVDLSEEIYSGMDVYPGDPKVTIEKFLTIKEDGYKVSKISFGVHIGTHVDVPSHMIKKGKDLGKYSLNKFVGNAKIINSANDITNDITNDIKRSGIIILSDEFNPTKASTNKIIKLKPKLVGYTKKSEPNIDLTKKLLNADILLVGPLKIPKGLPQRFFFCAFPLKLRSLEGSPVRAVAITAF